MRVRLLGAWLCAIALLAGCAAPVQNPVGLAGDYFSARSGRIGVAMTAIPAPDTNFPGADCLLCLAAASVANREMTTAVATWSTEDLKALKAELVAALAARGQQAQAIDEPLKLDALPERAAEPGMARRDFSAVRQRAGVDRLLVVDIGALGAWRNYAAYVPTGAPRAVFKAEAYIVDLATHKLEWYERFDLGRAAEGNWDEPPKFPGLSNAHFQVLEEGKDAIKKPFLK